MLRVRKVMYDNLAEGGECLTQALGDLFDLLDQQFPLFAFGLSVRLVLGNGSR